eukprot:3931643-Rhodomonas_salina.1
MLCQHRTSHNKPAYCIGKPVCDYRTPHSAGVGRKQRVPEQLSSADNRSRTPAPPPKCARQFREIFKVGSEDRDCHPASDRPGARLEA